MKKSIFHSVLWLAVLLPSLAPISALADDKPFSQDARPVIDDIVKPQMKDGFGAEFWIIDDGNSVEKLIPEDLRGVQPAYAATRHKPLRLLVFILNPGHIPTVDYSGNEINAADVTYDLTVQQPDGHFKDGCKGMTGWSGAAPTSHLTHIAKATIKIVFEAIDPPGTYTFTVVVHDNVRKVDITLTHRVRLRDQDTNENQSTKWSASPGL